MCVQKYAKDLIPIVRCDKDLTWNEYRTWSALPQFVVASSFSFFSRATQALDKLRPSQPSVPETPIKEEESQEEDADFEQVITLLKKLELDSAKKEKLIALLQ